MNNLFADWHNEVSIGLPGDVLSQREAAADGVVAAVTSEQVVDLLAAAFERTEARRDLVWFREAVKEYDPTFRMRGNDREVAVLAGACLWELASKNDILGWLAGYGCVLASTSGWNSSIQGLSEHADDKLRKHGAAARRIAPPPDEVDTKTVLTASVRKAVDAGLADDVGLSTQSVREAFVKLAQSLDISLKDLARQVDKLNAWSDHSVRVCSEEGALLGWLLAGHSTTFDKPWTAIGESAAAEVAGTELADLVELMPAPPHTFPLLQQFFSATRFTAKKNSASPDQSHSDTEVPAELGFLHIAGPEDEAPADTAFRRFNQAMLRWCWIEG